jgi:hypothetical protein
MDDLNANARALINAARSFDDPTDNDQDRVRAAVLMRVGSIAAVGTAAVTAAKASSAAASAAPLIASSLTSATLFSGVAAKIGAVVMLGAIASGAYVAFRAPAKPTVAVSASKPSVAAVVAPAAPAVEAASTIAEPAVDAADLPIEDTKPSPSRVRNRAADLEGEMKLLRQADGALRRGDAAAALVALNKHAAQYPGGVLAQEREGVRAIALCSSGNTSAGQSAAQRFLSSASKSPLASRIRSACSLKE